AVGGASLGASAIIYGLAVMSLVWVPKGEIWIWYAFWIVLYVRHGSFAVRIWKLALFLLAWDALLLWIDSASGFSSRTALLHLMGAGVGLVPAIALLRYGIVDGDGEDLLSLLRRGKKKGSDY